MYESPERSEGRLNPLAHSDRARSCEGNRTVGNDASLSIEPGAQAKGDSKKTIVKCKK
jgi:hypothetical protein